MPRLRYKYNSATCRYEPFRVKGKLLWKRVFIFLSLSLTLAIMGYSLTISYYESLDEALLRDENNRLKVEWNILHEQVSQAQAELTNIIKKDDYNYRFILDSSPLDSSIREAGVGGSEKLELGAAQRYPAIVNEYLILQKLQHQLDVEVQSYAQLEGILNDRLIEWSTRPAIQPINNKQLDRLHMSYGLRMHPKHHVMMDHKGLDFSAAHGTPVYATGDGEVKMAYFSSTYGNVIYLDHDYNYETRYAHLSGYAVKPGDKVKRGQIIGYVGSTGTSVGPHLHYEVLYDGQHVNPINFFQRDLSNEEYQKLIDAGSQYSNSLD